MCSGMSVPLVLLLIYENAGYENDGLMRTMGHMRTFHFRFWKWFYHVAFYILFHFSFLFLLYFLFIHSFCLFYNHFSNLRKKSIKNQMFNCFKFLMRTLGHHSNAMSKFLNFLKAKGMGMQLSYNTCRLYEAVLLFTNCKTIKRHYTGCIKKLHS